jgi:hypothetical protein
MQKHKFSLSVRCSFLAVALPDSRLGVSAAERPRITVADAT